MLDSNSDFGLGEIGETARDFGRSSDDICKEYILTWSGVGWTVPRVDDLGLSRYGVLAENQLPQPQKNWRISGGSQRGVLCSSRVERGRG